MRYFDKTTQRDWCIWLAITATAAMASIVLAQGTTVSPTPQAPVTGLDLPISDPTIAIVSTSSPVETDDEDTDNPVDLPPPTIYGEEIDSLSEKIVYVIDVSGSMGEDNQPFTVHTGPGGIGGAFGLAEGSITSGNRIDRAKSELIRSVSSLPENFSFDMIAYDCNMNQWQRTLVPANVANKIAAIGWISGLVPLDSTGTGPAVSLGLGIDRTNLMVVLLTDGAPNCGAVDMNGHRYMIRASNSQGAKINVFGIAASGSYREFCQAVAADSGGSYYDVP